MPSQEEFDELKGRLEKLENHVAGAATPQFTDEELAAFKKVSSAMADTGDFCGINDCFRPRLCSRAASSTPRATTSLRALTSVTWKPVGYSRPAQPE